MTLKDFEDFLTDFDTACDHLMTTKGHEYARSEDRFGNFNRLSDILKVSREQIALVYFMKHLDSIVSFVTTGQKGVENIQSRFHDAVNYLKLMAGMIYESSLSTTCHICGIKGGILTSVGDGTVFHETCAKPDPVCPKCEHNIKPHEDALMEEYNLVHAWCHSKNPMPKPSQKDNPPR